MRGYKGQVCIRVKGTSEKTLLGSGLWGIREGVGTTMVYRLGSSPYEVWLRL